MRSISTNINYLYLDIYLEQKQQQHTFIYTHSKERTNGQININEIDRHFIIFCVPPNKLDSVQYLTIYIYVCVAMLEEKRERKKTFKTFI